MALKHSRQMPDFLAPMLTRLSTMPGDQSQWAFEVKWDGVRAIARCQAGEVRLLARGGKDVSATYPELQDLGAALRSREAMLDGEIVAFDRRGRPSFQALQGRMHLHGEQARRLARSAPVTYIAFDLLWLDGKPLTELPYERRREQLAALGLEGPRWRTPAHHVSQGDALLSATWAQGLEGVVAKRLGSVYVPGRRESSWLKIKHSMRQELVIGGWTDGKGQRADRFGALELGVHDQAGVLRYAGRVGTGFSERELDRLAALLRSLAQAESPFTGDQPARGAHFVRPQLVCEVEFSEWTADGRLRQASYRGLRDDKDAAAVIRERPLSPAVAGMPEASPAPGTPVTPSTSRTPRMPRGSGRGPSVAPPLSVMPLTALLEAGREVRGGVEIEIEGRSLKLTNLDKVLYPATGFTKGDLIGWYASIAAALLPHLHDRPLTLKRYPDGVEGKHFYEKQSPRHRPDWVQTVTAWSEHGDRDVQYTLCQDLPTLVWLANLADIELHPSLSRAPVLQRPSAMAFDLDPGPPASILACCEVALELQRMFDQLGLASFAKTSGSKGLQVYVPLNTDEVDYAQTKAFAHAVANLLAQRLPEQVTATMGKAQRQGKVMIDWSQNDEHKTTVCVYSLRARERPTVSTPLTWEEVANCHASQEESTLDFDADQALARVQAQGDLFAGVLSIEQRLPDIVGNTQAGRHCQ